MKIEFSKTQSVLNITALSLILIFTTSCGQGFKSAAGFNSAGKASCAPSLCMSQPGPSLPGDPWEKVDLDGTVSAGIFGKHKVIDVDKIRNLLLISIPLPINPFGGMVSLPLPQAPDIEVGVEQSGSSYALVMKVPLKYIVKGVQFADAGKLPNGNPLPGVPGGELPRLGLKIFKNANEAYLYLGKGAVAVFVPTPKFNPYVNLTFPIKNKSQRKIIGYFASVAQQNPYAGGFFLSVVLPDDIQRAIDDIIP